MKELLTGKLGQVKFNPAMLHRVTLNQVTMGLAFALALVAIVSSVLIAPRSNEQVIELTPLQPAQELQASINPAQSTTSVASSTEVRESASLKGQTSAVESAVQESTIQESTLQELPVAEQAASSSTTEQTTTEQEASSSNVPGTIPTRSTEKISEIPYLQDVASKPASSMTTSSVTAAITETSRPRSTTRTEIARKTVTRSSLPLRRDAGSISVQAGAFKSLENAQKLTSRLQAAGIRAGVEKGKTMYRVLVGPYASESDARAAARGVLPLAQ
jgi:cell division protein FtsN